MDVFRADVLEGRVALVTGGGSGICRGIAQAFLRHGAEVAIVGCKAERLEDAAAQMQTESGRRCLAVPFDVRDVEGVKQGVARTLEALGRIDVLVNGAAGNFLCPAASLSANALETVLDIDTVGTFNVSRAVFDAWMRDHGGCIINISAVLEGTPAQAHAAAAKAGVDALTRTLAVEWGPAGIRVNGIAPGPIEDTEGVARLVPEKVRAKLASTIPIRRFGRIDEVAALALFLATDAASLIHGTTVVADGGAHLPPAAAAVVLGQG